ncbi:MAG: hypothetical protein H5U25_05550 [Oceanibaculum nanhaiense]|nr:hypothetical protein [Oceanibaculum nanhaiense]
MFFSRPVLGDYGPLWQSLDAVGRDNLLSEFISRGYVIVQADLDGTAPPILSQAFQTYYLFDPGGTHPLDSTGADGGGVRIGITKAADAISGAPLWWIAAGALALVAIAALTRR